MMHGSGLAILPAVAPISTGSLARCAWPRPQGGSGSRGGRNGVSSGMDSDGYMQENALLRDHLSRATGLAAQTSGPCSREQGPRFHTMGRWPGTMPRVTVPDFVKSGGPEGTRTPGLHSAIVALSQLSYRPDCGAFYRRRRRSVKPGGIGGGVHLRGAVGYTGVR